MHLKHHLLTILFLLLFIPAAGASNIIFLENAQQDLNHNSFPLLKKLDNILNKVSTIRQLPIKTPVKVETLTPKQVFKNLSRHVEKEIPSEKFEGEQALYQTWGLLKPDFPLRQFLLELYAEQIGGYYDPEYKTLYLVKGIVMSNLNLELTIAHELTHALQDQNFDLGQFIKSNQFNEDRSLAQMAVIEGDATIVSMEYIQQSLKESLNFLDILKSAMDIFRIHTASKSLEKSPPFLKNSMMFPYIKGQQFIQFFQLNKGWQWKDINQLYQQPPQATEHILHPHTYLNHEEPTLPVYSLYSNLKSNWKLLTTGVLGELTFRHLFNHYFSVKDSHKIARGWQGDYFEVYKNENNIVIMINTVWDSKADAEEFEKAYKKMTQSRKKINSTMIKRSNKKVLVIEGYDQLTAHKLPALL